MRDGTILSVQQRQQVRERFAEFAGVASRQLASTLASDGDTEGVRRRSLIIDGLLAKAKTASSLLDLHPDGPATASADVGYLLGLKVWRSDLDRDDEEPRVTSGPAVVRSAFLSRCVIDDWQQDLMHVLVEWPDGTLQVGLVDDFRIAGDGDMDMGTGFRAGDKKAPWEDDDKEEADDIVPADSYVGRRVSVRNLPGYKGPAVGNVEKWWIVNVPEPKLLFLVRLDNGDAASVDASDCFAWQDSPGGDILVVDDPATPHPALSPEQLERIEKIMFGPGRSPFGADGMPSRGSLRAASVGFRVPPQAAMSPIIIVSDRLHEGDQAGNLDDKEETLASYVGERVSFDHGGTALTGVVERQYLSTGQKCELLLRVNLNLAGRVFNSGPGGTMDIPASECFRWVNGRPPAVPVKAFTERTS